MATRTVTTEDISGDGAVMKFTWTGLLNTDDGTPIKWTQWSDRSVQVLGTFGVGGSLRWEISNDGGTTFAPATDPQGTDINLTAAKIEAITEIAHVGRPRVTAGDGTTSLTCVVIASRQTPMRT